MPIDLSEDSSFSKVQIMLNDRLCFFFFCCFQTKPYSAPHSWLSWFATTTSVGFMGGGCERAPHFTMPSTYSSPLKKDAELSQMGCFQDATYNTPYNTVVSRSFHFNPWISDFHRFFQLSQGPASPAWATGAIPTLAREH